MRQAICLFITAFATSSLIAQYSITGPACVTTQTTYQYLITGNSDTSSAIHVCVTGGRFQNSPDNCINVESGQIKITWNGDIVNGNISINGNALINVTITPPLNGGLVDSSTRAQLTDTDSIPLPINCSPASNGSCNPVYSYQWQQSDNKLRWQDITNETNQNLGFSTLNQAASYYRRKVIETNSGTIEYSDIASVYITPKPNN